MTTNKKQDREAVRLLALEHGLKRASELCDVNYDVVRQWSVRGKWKIPVSHSVTKRAADAIQHELAEHERSTKLGLATYAKRQAEHLAEKGKLADHGAFRNITAGSAQLHAWNEEKSGNVFSLNVLNLNVLSETDT